MRLLCIHPRTVLLCRQGYPLSWACSAPPTMTLLLGVRYWCDPRLVSSS